MWPHLWMGPSVHMLDNVVLCQQVHLVGSACLTCRVIHIIRMLKCPLALVVLDFKARLAESGDTVSSGFSLGRG